MMRRSVRNQTPVIEVARCMGMKHRERPMRRQCHPWPMEAVRMEHFGKRPGGSPVRCAPLPRHEAPAPPASRRRPAVETVDSSPMALAILVLALFLLGAAA